jgi:chromatin remodeling complex protein RSC6
VEDQIWQGNGLNVDAFDFTPNLDASFRVKIQGRLLDDDSVDGDQEKKSAEGADADETMAGTDTPKEGEIGRPTQGATPKYRFSHYLKSLVVEFDSSRFRNGAEMNVEWKKGDAGKGHGPSAASDFDELMFKRTGDENTNITIKLLRHELPERYKLSPELADVVDMKEATQHEAVMGLWEYIRLSGLQEDEEKRNFRCDDLLRKVSFALGAVLCLRVTKMMPRLSGKVRLVMCPC